MTDSSSVVLIGLARLRRNSNWHDLESWKWRERLALVSHGVPTTIQMTEPAALVPIKLRLPPGWREIEEGTSDPDYSLVVGNEVAPPGLGHLHLLFRGESLISAAYNLEPVLGALEAELDRRVASLATPERIFIPAGVVGWRGRAIVIVGPPQSGTSTLNAALLRAGGSFYSDHYAVIDYEGRVHPYARPLWLCAGTAGNPVRYRPEELGARAGTQPLKIGMVVFTSYQPNARPRFAPLTRAAAGAELMANATSAALRSSAAAQSAMVKALAGAWILKGMRGEAADVLDLLLGAGHKRGERKTSSLFEINHSD